MIDNAWQVDQWNAEQEADEEREKFELLYDAEQDRIEEARQERLLN